MMCFLTYTTANNASSILPHNTAPKPVEVVKEDTKTVMPLNTIIQLEYAKLRPKSPINKDYIKRIIQIESDYDSTLIGSSGERGLMQIMPGTWNSFTTISFDSAFIRKYNVEVGIKYLNNIHYSLRNEHPTWKTLSIKEQQRLIAAAYNGGYSRLKNAEFQIDNMPQRIINYVNKL